MYGLYHGDPVRALTKCLVAYNVHRGPPKAASPFLYDSEGFYDTDIRSYATSQKTPSQPNMATPQVCTKGRVCGALASWTMDTSHVASSHGSRAAAGIHASSPEGNGPGLCTIILAGGRSGGHQAAVMCAVRHQNLDCPLAADPPNYKAFHPTLPLIATGGVGLSQSWRFWFEAYSVSDG